MQFATPDSAEMRASGGQGAGPGQVSGLQAGHGGLWLGLEGRFMPAFYRTKGFSRRGAGHAGEAPAVTSFLTGGQDTVNVMRAPGAEALTGHRECTLGTETVKAIVGTQLKFPFSGASIGDPEWDGLAFAPCGTLEQGGLKFAGIGQAFPCIPTPTRKGCFPNARSVSTRKLCRR